MHALKLCSVFVGLLLTAGAAAENDWPQWRGPNRNGLSTETGLMKQWPKGGPAVAWSIKNVGRGYGSVSMFADRIYVQGTQDGKSAIFCLNRANGATVWAKPLGRSVENERGSGPRGTPTIDGDWIYALTEDGQLTCMLASNGTTVWTRNILADFRGPQAEWLLSESPLVDGKNVIVTPGGKGACIVALDKMTGKTVWTTGELNDPAAYSSCIVADIQGVRTYMTMTGQAGVGVRASDGKLMWRYTKAANDTANVATPVFFEDKVFYTSAYSTGSALLKLKAENGLVKADEVYFSREMMNHHGGVLLVNGYLYGYSNAILTCMEFNTGKVMWKNRSVGKGCLTYADGMLYILGEENTVGLVEANPAAYVEKGRCQIADQGFPSWAHPVICGGKLYIRNQGLITAYDITAK
jgi:outer membrane protein assembly factor BamB